jgi:hypothetical protein
MRNSGEELVPSLLSLDLVGHIDEGAFEVRDVTICIPDGSCGVLDPNGRVIRSTNLHVEVEYGP